MKSAVTMESAGLNKSNAWFLTGFGLLNTVVFSFIVVSLSFILGFVLAFC
jgi:ABC-type sugar transport system permease subunit